MTFITKNTGGFLRPGWRKLVRVGVSPVFLKKLPTEVNEEFAQQFLVSAFPRTGHDLDRQPGPSEPGAGCV